MRPYITITVTIGSEHIRIAKDSIYRLPQGGVEGIESTELEAVITEYASMDGGYSEGVKIPPRPIRLSFVVDDLRQTEEVRNRLIAFFSPKKHGTLTIERGGKKRKIDFVMAEGPRFIQNNIVLDKLRVELSLVCPDPYFRDVNPSKVNFMHPVPLLTFPFNSIAGGGITTGILTVTDTATLVNDGDVPVGIICDITASGGTVTNPRITMNGQYVRVIKTLDIGDTLKINTIQGSKGISVNGVNRFIFDRKSVFFQLPVGESTITISADAGVKDAKASFEYSFKYLGV